MARSQEAKRRWEQSEKGKQHRARVKADWYGKYIKGALSAIKASAKKRNIEVTLTEDSLRSWWEETANTCHYCGISTEEYISLRDSLLASSVQNAEANRFKYLLSNPNAAKIEKMTIDRVNNSRGYEVDNLVKCCWFCNRIKGPVLDEDEMHLIAKRVIGRLRDAVEVSG
jgi:hypothetical protein